MKNKQVVDVMMANDAFSRWLGIEVEEVKEGYCRLQMKVREEMLNGFYIAHGGITYSLADSALAFAANSHGQKAVSVETSISHLLPVKAGDTLIAEAFEKSVTNKIGVYEVEIKNQEKQLVALFKGTVYRTSKIWE
ncbi:MAG TPA: hydroxyphenylacetyl-CoA thioesterase PaaI [Flavobacteriales bacterium]|nr:hydroxyphenylacetyl-CoA thioesterase PaaI [Flavobacteriales bacterium]